MESPTVDSSPEWRLLVLVAGAGGNDERSRRALRIVEHTPLDPDRLVGIAARHGMVPLLAEFLHRVGRAKVLPVRSRRHLRESLEYNRYRTGRHVAEAVRLTAALAAAGLAVAVTKGVAAQAVLYDGSGGRSFNDIDLMIRPGERRAVAAVLAAHGYREGEAYEHTTGRLVAIPQRESAAYRLYPDHLPHMTRLTGDEALPFLVVDVAFSLTWFTSGWSVPIDVVLAERGSVDVPGGVLPTLDPVFDFLFLCLHLFREGWLADGIATKDVRLAQFADVCRHWERRSRARRDDIRAVLDRYGLHAPVGWVAGHTDSLLGTAIGPELGLAAYTGEAWLQSAYLRAGRYLRWTGTMGHRLAEPGPPALAGHDDVAGVARFVPPGRGKISSVDGG